MPAFLHPYPVFLNSTPVHRSTHFKLYVWHDGDVTLSTELLGTGMRRCVVVVQDALLGLTDAICSTLSLHSWHLQPLQAVRLSSTLLCNGRVLWFQIISITVFPYRDTSDSYTTTPMSVRQQLYWPRFLPPRLDTDSSVSFDHSPSIPVRWYTGLYVDLFLQFNICSYI